jgi:phasin family protein
MFAINEQFSKLSANGFENILRVAQISLDTSERLIKQQFEQSKQVLEANVQASKELTELTDPQQILAQANKLFSQSFEKAVSNSHNIYDIVSQTRSELAALAEDSFTRFNKTFISELETLSQNGPAGTDAAVNALKSSFAAAAATVNSLTRTAQQVADITESSIKAASNSTSDAIKTQSKRSRT